MVELHEDLPQNRNMTQPFNSGQKDKFNFAEWLLWSTICWRLTNPSIIKWTILFISNASIAVHIILIAWIGIAIFSYLCFITFQPCYELGKLSYWLTYNVLQGRFINKNTHYKSKNYRSESVFIYSHKHAQMKKRFGVLEGVPFLCQRQTKNKQCFTQFFLGLFGKIQNEIFIFSSQIQNLRKTNYIPSRKIFLYWYPLPPMVERLRAI